MNVGILGSGDVTKSLAGDFVKHGHRVTLGTRDTGKLKDFVAQRQGAQTGSFADAAKFGESSCSRSRALRRSMPSRPAGAPGKAGNRRYQPVSPTHRRSMALNSSPASINR